MGDAEAARCGCSCYTEDGHDFFDELQAKWKPELEAKQLEAKHADKHADLGACFEKFILACTHPEIQVKTLSDVMTDIMFNTFCRTDEAVYSFADAKHFLGVKSSEVLAYYAEKLSEADRMQAPAPVPAPTPKRIKDRTAGKTAGRTAKPTKWSKIKIARLGNQQLTSAAGGARRWCSGGRQLVLAEADCCAEADYCGSCA